MNEFSSGQRRSRPGTRYAWMAACSVVIVGSAAFTAAGGIGTLKRWLVKVDVDGEIVHLQTDANGEASMTIDTEDGQAQVFVKRWEEPDGESGTHVKVVNQQGDHPQENVETLVRRRLGPQQFETLPLDTIAGLQPAAAWTRAGNKNELYLLADGAVGQTVFLILRDAGTEAASLIKAGGFPRVVDLEEDPPAVSVADDGTLTIELDDGAGRMMVAKLKVQVDPDGDDELSNLNDLQVPTAGGEIRVGIEEVDDE